MKKILLPLFILCNNIQVVCQELLPGDQASGIILPASLNGGKPKAVSTFAGKLLIIDFWATWCSPCISAMKDLEKYKAALGDQLEILAISDESASRLVKFQQARPSTLTLASDTAETLQAYFPHRTIPHTVLIGPEGKIYAITDAGSISLDVLKLALKGVAMNLPLKKDQIGFNIDEYFQADSTLPRYFSMFAPVKGAGTMSKSYPSGGFKDRRFSIVNMPLEGLFRLAYEKTYYLVANEYDTVKRAYADKEKFSLDAWIETADKTRLMKFIQQKLKEHFVDVDAVLQKRKKTVLLIKATKEATRLLKPSTVQTDQTNAGGGHFEGTGVKLEALAAYMEDFGLFPGKVIDDTGLNGHYDIFFEWQPEKKDALKESFAKMGLYWEEAEREVEVLVLRRKK